MNDAIWPLVSGDYILYWAIKSPALYLILLIDLV